MGEQFRPSILNKKAKAANIASSRPRLAGAGGGETRFGGVPAGRGAFHAIAARVKPIVRRSLRQQMEYHTPIKTYMALRMSLSDQLPEAFREDDVRYPDELVEYFVREFTNPGDVVLDPFAGFGTTMRVAERLDHVAFGVELEPRRTAWARERLRHPEHLYQANARLLRALGIPPVDLAITDSRGEQCRDLQARRT